MTIHDTLHMGTHTLTERESTSVAGHGLDEHKRHGQRKHPANAGANVNGLLEVELGLVIDQRRQVLLGERAERGLNDGLLDHLLGHHLLLAAIGRRGGRSHPGLSTRGSGCCRGLFGDSSGRGSGGSLALTESNIWAGECHVHGHGRHRVRHRLFASSSNRDGDGDGRCVGGRRCQHEDQQHARQDRAYKRQPQSSAADSLLLLLLLLVHCKMF
ncbi:hypothetical protein BC828DRAFT_373193 [Blastocladiella britannica]|nr:hypothetical protein BC828DRAFT_373193 [Blastocladiella britannica]